MDWLVIVMAAAVAGFAVSALLRSGHTDREAAEYAEMQELHESVRKGKAPKPEGPLAGLAASVGKIVPLAKGDAARYRSRLLRAGIKKDPDTWHGAEILAVFCLGVLGLLMGGSYDGVTPLAFGGLAGAAVGWIAPRAYVSSRTKARRARIENDLPDVLDLLAINVQAGSTLGRGMKQIAAKCEGPLAEEFAQVDRDVNLFNIGTADAIMRMSDRCGSPQVSVFCSALTQSVKQGANIEPTLKNQAEIARKQKNDAMEEKIGRIPVHATPVMIIFVLATIAAAIVPVLYSIFTNLGAAV